MARNHPGKASRQLRKLAGKTQSEGAIFLGTNRATMSLFESGYHDFDAATVARLNAWYMKQATTRYQWLKRDQDTALVAAEA